MMSASISEITKALVKAQAVIKAAPKDAVNPHFRSKYSDLPSVYEACREALTSNGIAVSQVPVFSEGEQFLKTILMHVSGEWIAGDYALRPTKNDPQGMGSALTYARRYSLASMVGVVSDDDDDGNAASRPRDDRASSKHSLQKNAEAHAANAEKTKAATDTKNRREKFCAWAKDYCATHGLLYTGPALARIYDHVNAPDMDGKALVNAFEAFVASPDESVFKGMN